MLSQHESPLAQFRPPVQEGGDTHVPPEQLQAAGHALPHAPQLAKLLVRSTHPAVPQQASPGPQSGPPLQEQTDPTHVLPRAQGVEHIPQLAASLVRSAHTAPQQVLPVPHGSPPLWQVHVELEHTPNTAHLTPHAPQLLGSSYVLVHVSPQHVAPTGHAGTQSAPLLLVVAPVLPVVAPVLPVVNALLLLVVAPVLPVVGPPPVRPGVYSGNDTTHAPPAASMLTSRIQRSLRGRMGFTSSPAIATPRS
jgi:hypothetical protein